MPVCAHNVATFPGQARQKNAASAIGRTCQLVAGTRRCMANSNPAPMSTLFFVRLPFHQLDADVIRAFDERELDLSARHRTRLIGHPNAIVF